MCIYLHSIVNSRLTAAFHLLSTPPRLTNHHPSTLQLLSFPTRSRTCSLIPAMTLGSSRRTAELLNWATFVLARMCPKPSGLERYSRTSKRTIQTTTSRLATKSTWCKQFTAWKRKNVFFQTSRQRNLSTVYNIPKDCEANYGSFLSFVPEKYIKKEISLKLYSIYIESFSIGVVNAFTRVFCCKWDMKTNVMIYKCLVLFARPCWLGSF